MRRMSLASFAAVCLAMSVSLLVAQRPTEPNISTAGTTPPESLRRQYFDRHFEGLHPSPRLEFGGAKAGEKLFEMRGKRADALAARIRSAGALAPQTAPTPAVLPGLTTRQPMLG